MVKETKTPTREQLATYSGETSFTEKETVYRKKWSIEIYRMPNETYELHFREQFVGHEASETVQKFDSFFKAYETVGKSCGMKYADKLIDTMLSLEPELEGATV